MGSNTDPYATIKTSDNGRDEKVDAVSSGPARALAVPELAREPLIHLPLLEVAG